MSHTPGPWKSEAICNSTGSTLYHVHSFVESAGGTICGSWNGSNEDDMLLIAAAPEMYEALQKLVAAQKYHDEQTHSEGICMAVAALAKARGEA